MFVFFLIFLFVLYKGSGTQFQYGCIPRPPPQLGVLPLNLILALPTGRLGQIPWVEGLVPQA